MLKSKKIIALLLSFAIVTLFFVPAAALEDLNDEENTSQFSLDDFEVLPLETDPELLYLNKNADIKVAEEKLDNNLANTERAYANIIQSFYNAQADDQKYQDGIYTVSGITEEGFPESYAGAYVNQELNLVVLLTESATKTEDTLINAQKTLAKAAESNGLIFASANYSYSHLVSLMNDIYQYTSRTDTEKDDGFSVVYYAIDDYNNCVDVGLEDISVESIAAFKEAVCDSDALSFKVAVAESAVDESVLYPGQEIENHDTNSYASMGFRARKYENGSYTYGFVTAGHAFDWNDDVYIGSSVVGTVDSSSWQCSGNMDATFIETVSSYSVSTTISYIGGTLTSAIDANLAQGDPVTMVGRTTQGTTGTVQYISYSFTDSGVSWTDLVAASYNSDSGDSGGIVISTSSGNYISGIHKGRLLQYAIYSKAQNITTGFGLSLY